MTDNDFQTLLAGRVIRLDDDIDTDLIYPGRYVPLVDPAQWAAHALEGIDPSLASRITRGDIIVAGRNFGCGSSRSQAVSCLLAAGISAVVAGSFARIFFRNSINQGLPVVVSPRAAHTAGDRITINFDTSRLILGEIEIAFDPLPDFLMEILGSGGLKPYTRKRLMAQRQAQGSNHGSDFC